MTRRVGWLLTEIERQADGKMSDLARCELVAEVADHLDAAIQARMEMGIDVDEAERQAVKEFGAPKEYVKDLLKVHRPSQSKNIWKGDRATMIIFWAGFASLFSWLVSAPKEFSAPYFFGTIALFLTAFAIASFRSRAVRPLPLAKASFFAYLISAVALTLTWHNLWVHGGTGEMPDWRVVEYVDLYNGELPVLSADLKLLGDGIRLHQPPRIGQAINKPSQEEQRLMLTAPVLPAAMAAKLSWGTVDPTGDNHITLRPVATIEEANENWRYAAKNYLGKLEYAKERFSDTITSIDAAQSSGIFSDLPQNLWETLGIVPFLFLPCAFLNCIFGWLGWLTSNYRITRRRRAG